MSDRSEPMHVATIWLDTKSGWFVAESRDPGICARGRVPSAAFRRLLQAMQQAEENELPPKSNVIPFRRHA